MEVHKHPHHITHSKKWGEYVLEFLMLFLAVFLGFLAENQRESIVERHREKEYILSMIEDLQTDTANLSKVIASYGKMISRLDTAITGFDNGVHTFSERWTNNFIHTIGGGFPDFYQSDRTIQQLKNAGGMRLILHETAALGIIKYDADVKDLSSEAEVLSRDQNNYIDEVLKVWSVNKMYKEAGVNSWVKSWKVGIHHNYWLTKDPVAFEFLFNRLANYNDATFRMERNCRNMKTKAIHLIALLKKEYSLE